jgi:hypothetical protein
MKLKAKQNPGASSEASDGLADRIRATCAEAEQYISARIAAVKASPEGQQLPLDWLRQNIYATHKARGCHCRCALSLLEDKKHG